MQHASKVLAVAVGFLLGSVSAVSAGVVMSETAVASGLNGNEMVHRTIYVQGNKQKVDTDGLQTITDLDKRLVYVVDKTHKDYVELPLASMSDASWGVVKGSAELAWPILFTSARCMRITSRNGSRLT